MSFSFLSFAGRSLLNPSKLFFPNWVASADAPSTVGGGNLKLYEIQLLPVFVQSLCDSSIYIAK
jgi:hypothetical protein